MVSGFFILFEEQYFVSDVVQIGDAVGRVEAINIRHTQIRDEYGKLYIIPNGQIKTVVNYSKGFVNAVVDIRVPTSVNLDQVMRRHDRGRQTLEGPPPRGAGRHRHQGAGRSDADRHDDPRRDQGAARRRT